MSDGMIITQNDSRVTGLFAFEKMQDGFWNTLDYSFVTVNTDSQEGITIYDVNYPYFMQLVGEHKSEFDLDDCDIIQKSNTVSLIKYK